MSLVSNGGKNMSIMTVTSIVVTICALFSYLNYKYIKLPVTIGIMAIALIFSTLIMLLEGVGLNIAPTVNSIMGDIDFSKAVLDGMLSFLLFAGSLHVPGKVLHQEKYVVGILALLGTSFSTMLVATLVYNLFPMLGFEISFINCILFGALVSPTDPIAVMAILRKAGVAKSLETKVVGESLFNDGIAIVIFLTVLSISAEGAATPGHVAMLFLEEAVGGVILGIVLGSICLAMVRTVDNYHVVVFITLATVMGGYEIAKAIHTSGPIAMVVAGLIVGNIGRSKAMSEKTKEILDNFWELIDEFLNAILFMLVGFSLLIVEFNQSALIAGIIMVPALLCIRYMSVFIPVTILQRFRSFSPGTVNILTWGGLRGGLSLAMCLSLPANDLRDFMLLVVYCIVLFSILVQALTIGKLAQRYTSPNK